MANYYIVVTDYDNDSEIVDETDNLKDASYLVNEYKIAFNYNVIYKNIRQRSLKSLQRTKQGKQLIKEWNQ